MLYAVMLAGGRGERFWPMSRVNRPKQLLRLMSERTMLEETMNRIAPMIPSERMRVVCGEPLAELIRETVPQLQHGHFIIEPEAKNTAPAVALAAAHLYAEDPDATMLVLACDHAIEPVDEFREVLRVTNESAVNQDVLCCIGIEPTRADTGYGYIHLGEKRFQQGHISTYLVRAFREKPSPDLAQQYYFDHQHLWNAGIFIWRARVILEAIEEHMPQLSAQLHVYRAAIGTDQESSARKTFFERIEGTSIDYGVLEKASNVLVVKGNFFWDDIGSWSALERLKPRDKKNNVALGSVFTLDTFETTLVNDDADGLLVAFGVSDLILVKSNDVVLVAHRTRAGELRELLRRLKEDPTLERFL